VGVGEARSLFLFGTLRDPELLAIVAGPQLSGRSAGLPDHRVALVKGETYPLLTPEVGRLAAGLLLDGLTDAQIARIDYYEAPYGYTRQQTEVVCEGSIIKADVYRPAEQQKIPGEDWSLKKWQPKLGPLVREAAVEIMASMGKIDPSQIAAQQPVIHARAQQRLNARRTKTPVELRHPNSRSDAQLHARHRAYSLYFALDDLILSYKRFSGAQSGRVERAVFVAGDAVTVLPYDPKRDRVLLIEQFRPGCFLRGDPHPWSLEAVAGRQDPGETHEETARREAQEEAGISIGALHRASSYYSSPGSSTEYLTSFIGLADLPDGVEGIGGLEEEGEDIRSLIASFDELMTAVETGEAENAPLVLSALWLAANRDRLRQEG
jgi:nudix-type nucleoside diphosphatase (YffH/AdpP family)